MFFFSGEQEYVCIPQNILFLINEKNINKLWEKKKFHTALLKIPIRGLVLFLRTIFPCNKRIRQPQIDLANLGNIQAGAFSFETIGHLRNIDD